MSILALLLEILHRHDYEGWRLGARNYTKISSFELFEKFGIDNCTAGNLPLCK
jgi:hypothetical protein